MKEVDVIDICNEWNFFDNKKPDSLIINNNSGCIQNVELLLDKLREIRDGNYFTFDEILNTIEDYNFGIYRSIASRSYVSEYGNALQEIHDYDNMDSLYAAFNPDEFEQGLEDQLDSEMDFYPMDIYKIIEVLTRKFNIIVEAYASDYVEFSYKEKIIINYPQKAVFKGLVSKSFSDNKIIYREGDVFKLIWI